MSAFSTPIGSPKVRSMKSGDSSITGSENLFPNITALSFMILSVLDLMSAWKTCLTFSHPTITLKSNLRGTVKLSY